MYILYSLLLLFNLFMIYQIINAPYYYFQKKMNIDLNLVNNTLIDNDTDIDELSSTTTSEILSSSESLDIDDTDKITNNLSYVDSYD